MGIPSQNQTGVFVNETNNPAARPIQGQPVNVYGMVISAGRGWTSRPIKVNDIGRYQRIFGQPHSGCFSYESAAGFFDTLGRKDGVGASAGADLWLSRVVASSGGTNTAASLTSTAPSGAATAGSETGTGLPVIMAPGTTFIGKVDGGGTLTATIHATAASYTGGAYAPASVTAGHTLIVVVNGVTRTATASVGNEVSTEAKALAFLNSIPGISATDNGTNFTLTTDQEGSGATGIISASSSADVLTALGFTGGAAFTNAGPNNVANANIGGVTSAELAAIFNAAFTGSTTTSTTSSVIWTSNTTGSSSSVQFSSGTGVSLVTGFSTAINSGTAAGGATNVVTLTDVGPGLEGNNLYALYSNNTQYIGGISNLVSAGSGITQFTLTPAAASRVTVGDTLAFSDSTTSASCRGYVLSVNNYVVTLQTAVTLAGNLTTANTKINLESFNVTLYYMVNGNGQLLRTMPNLRMSPLSKQNYFVTVINNNDDEQQVIATDPGSTVGADNRPVNVLVTGDFFTGGSEASVYADTDWIGSSIQPKSGIYMFDRVKPVRHIAIPGVTGNTAGSVPAALLDYCSNRGDCCAVLGVPQGYTDEQAVTYRNSYLGGSSYGRMYAPWIYVFNGPAGQNLLYPPEGWVMGMNARCNNNRGIAKAPAGYTDGVIPGAVDVETRFDDSQVTNLTSANINSIRWDDDYDDVYVGLARTLQQEGDQRQIHVRDTLIYLETSCQRGTKNVFEEPNTPATQLANATVITNFLTSEWKKGTLVAIDQNGNASNKASDAFTVISDSSNNPLSVINADDLVTAVSVRIPHTVERSLITFSILQ